MNVVINAAGVTGPTLQIAPILLERQRIHRTSLGRGGDHKSRAVCLLFSVAN